MNLDRFDLHQGVEQECHRWLTRRFPMMTDRE
jgi:hypothetical protein